MELRIAWKVLFFVGFACVLMGLHFLFVRPAFVFFPEDSRFTQLSTQQLQAYNSNLFTWIGFVFRSWGAFALSAGVSIMGLSAYGLRKATVWAYNTLALAGLPLLSIFLLVNLSLRSDFVLIIGSLLALYFVALVLAFEEVHRKKTMNLHLSI